MRRLACVVVLAAAVLTLACGGGASSEPPSTGAPPAELYPAAGLSLTFSDKPLPLPAFTLTDVTTGQTIDRASWKGKVVLLNFWATWCGPCRTEIPDLIKLQDRYRDQLVIVGVSLDEGPKEDVTKYVAEHHMNYPVAIAGAEVERLFGGISSIPTTYVLNADSDIVQRHVGLLRADRTEHEVRALSKLPTAASVEFVADKGQILKANAIHATELPDIDFTGLTPAQKDAALKRMREEMCDCGCGSTIAECRVDDPACSTSKDLGNKIVAEIRKSGAR
jgi:cytochrome c biogenesis protein CcmG/thiol:disulfide interchange protein DsbE